MFLLKIIELSKVYTYITFETFEKLVEAYNKNIIPEIYDDGAIGNSGN